MVECIKCEIIDPAELGSQHHVSGYLERGFQVLDDTLRDQQYVAMVFELLVGWT